MQHPTTLEEEFGAIDIYLFDQILRGRITPRDRILDAGCGFGRNLVYLMRVGCDVHGVDADAESIGAVRAMARALAPALGADHFRVEPIESISLPDGFASVVISSAVLHFARDEGHFDAMLTGSWRCLAPGGMFFCRLASKIGLADAVSVGNGRYRLPDGTVRFLVDEAMLIDRTARLGGQLLDPLKTTLVHGQRSMTTWVVRKNGLSRG